MNPERWQQVDSLLQAALARPREERAEFLANACAGDEALRIEVESLVSSDQEVDSFLEAPLSEVAAKLLIGIQSQSIEGQIIGSYKVLSRLGAGGMGEVYLGLDTRLGRQIALKLLPAKFTKDKDRVRRFEQEARAASALNQPNIVTIHETGQIDELQYIVMEFIEGATLRQRIAGDASITPGEALDIAIQVANALEAAHAAGITHRDIKPENIIVRPDGLVKVLDFGLARPGEPASAIAHTHMPDGWVASDIEAAACSSQAPPNEDTPPDETAPGVVVGTPFYMSPEQARGQRVDQRTDLFSLGVVLYEMIAGRRPFVGSTVDEVIRSILSDEAAPLSDYNGEATPELERIAGKALCRDIEQRYQTAHEMVVDLKRLKQELEHSATGGHSSQVETSRGEPAGHSLAIGSILVRSRGLAIGALALVAIAVMAFYLLFARGSGKAIASVAVLPFTNVNSDPDLDYLGDGIANNIVNGLSRLQLPNLRVVPWSTVSRYRGQSIDSQEVGRALGVRAVVIGRLIQKGDQLNIQTEMVDVVDRAQLWGERYNRNAGDILELQDEIAKEISENLRLRLSSDGVQRLTRRYTNNTDAYGLYIKGRNVAEKRTIEGVRQSIQFFRQAIDADPNYPLAYSGLSSSLVILGRRGALAPREAYPSARRAVIRALELDETLAEAHLAQAQVKMALERDFSGAEKELQRAIELDPTYIEAHHQYSHLLVAMGRTADSLAESERCLEIDSLDPVMNAHLGWHFLFAGQDDQAVDQCRKAIQVGDSYWARFYLGQAYDKKREYDLAIAEFKQAISKSPDSTEAIAALGHAYAASGQPDQAYKVLEQLNEASKTNYTSLGLQAIIYAGLQNKEQALKWLQWAVDEPTGWVVYINIDPRFSQLRSDPQFKALVQRIGIPSRSV